jgi:hypothetical protein
LDTRVAITRVTCIGPNVWTLPVVGAIAYPILLQGFSLSVQASKANGIVASKIALAACAVVLLSLAVAVPCVAFRALIGIRNSIEPNAPIVRRVLHLAFATSPLYVLTHPAWLDANHLEFVASNRRQCFSNCCHERAVNSVRRRFGTHSSSNTRMS